MPAFSMTIQREYLNLLKWFALIAMVAFHFSKAFSYNQPEYLILLGRMAFPIFGFVLGYNLAAGELKGDKGLEARMMRLLLMFGCFAQPFYWAYAYAALPVNIMFTLALGVFMVFHFKHYSSWIVLIALGIFVDYAWAGALYVLASYLISRQALTGKVTLDYLLGFILVLAAVSLSTQSYYPMLTLGLFALGIKWKPSFALPRCKWLFYAFYPVHLAIIQGIQYLH